jgi:hypothetical protein
MKKNQIKNLRATPSGEKISYKPKDEITLKSV